jgi:hypothetical protein
VLFPVGVKSPAPGRARGPAFGAREEVFERDMEEGTARLSEDFAGECQLRVDMDSPAAALRDPRGDPQLPVDQNRPAVAHEDPRRDARETVPGGEEAAGLVERCPDEAAVCDSRRGLVALAERKGRLVALDPFVGRSREVDAVRVVAASPARGIVVRRKAVQRRPPRSKCAL